MEESFYILFEIVIIVVDKLFAVVCFLITWEKRFDENCYFRLTKNIWMDKNIKRRKQCKKARDKRCLNLVYHFAVKRVTLPALVKILMNLTYAEVSIKK